jgi:hypothetical protein
MGGRTGRTWRPSFPYINPRDLFFQVYCVHCVQSGGFPGLSVTGMRPVCVPVRPRLNILSDLEIRQILRS